MDKASLSAPSLLFAIKNSASSSYNIFSFLAIVSK